MNDDDPIETEMSTGATEVEQAAQDSETMGVGEAVLNNLLEVLGTLLTMTQGLIEDYGGAFLVGLFTLVLAWILATLLRGFTAKVLRAVGLDLVADRLGVRSYLRKRDVLIAPSQAFGWVLYLAILYMALIVFFDVLGLEVASTLLRTIASYLPKIFVAILLIVLGIVLGRWLDALVSRLARVSGLPGHRLLGSGARIAVFLLAFMFAVNSLGWISPSILIGGLAIVLGATLGLVVLFAFCARGLAESILARSFVTSLANPGDHIKIGSIEGVLQTVETASVRIDCGDRIIVLPSRHLANGTVEIRKSPEDLPADLKES
ncbi:MAG: hypothetical protein JJT75_11115 [Opitutales bacterium]|nr:hypothetical protein [Opitutales bacterium]MCH8541337.1 hypothetical protein [Opitutales bacterium]